MTSSLKLPVWRTWDILVFRMHSASYPCILVVGILQGSLLELTSQVEDFEGMTA